MPASVRRACPPSGYRRRRPELTGLYESVRQHAAEFLHRANESGGLPRHVAAEFERYLACGILAHGFVRVWCPTCRNDLVVAFSCKGRGFCPSCGGRRMADTAARWVDHVLPDVPWRQWVRTVPFELRVRLAWDPATLTDVLTVFQRAVAARLRLLARHRGLLRGRHASVTAIQRFGGALNLNVHFHSLVADGVWVEDEAGRLRFHHLRVSDDDVAAVVRRVERRTLKLLVARGWDADGPPPSAGDPDRQLELALLGGSLTGRTATGPRAGRELRRLRHRANDAPRSGLRSGCSSSGLASICMRGSGSAAGTGGAWSNCRAI